MLTALHVDPKQLSKLPGIWVAPSSGDGLPERYYPEAVADELVAEGWMGHMGAGKSWERFFRDLEWVTPDDTMWLGRARSIGHARQHLNLIGFALTVNSLALHRHQRHRAESLAA